MYILPDALMQKSVAGVSASGRQSCGGIRRRHECTKHSKRHLGHDDTVRKGTERCGRALSDHEASMFPCRWDIERYERAV